MLQVRCSTWEQVEAFHTRKLRKGKLLSMKVPFTAELGAKVTLGLELPNHVVIAIDGTVLKASPIEGDTKTWIEVELHGFTPEVIARVRGMEPEPTPVPISDTTARKSQPIAPPIRDEELPADERQLFQHLTGELRRLRTCAVHDVLGVARDADPEQIRRGWMNLVRRHHPDLVSRRNAPAITHLAEELTILANRAYDRLRFALVAEGRATTAGPVLSPPPGWLIGFDDISSSGRARSQPIAVVEAPAAARPRDPTNPPMSQVQGGEAFEQRARAMLSDGDADTAQEVLAAALCVYPRSRPLRSLYYVASAISALYKGEVMLATSQLETALAHHDECVEAAQILEILRRPGVVPGVDDEMKRLFR